MSYPDTSLASRLGGFIPDKNMDGFVANMEATEVVPTLCLHRTLSTDATDERRRRDPIGQLMDDLQIILGVHVAQGLLLFLLAVARYARCPCSVALIGPSSVGKTTVATRIAATQPVEDVKCLTHVTHAALAAGLGVTPTYDSAGNRMIDLRQKLLLLDENALVRDGNVLSSLRQVTSTEYTSRTKIERGYPVTTILRGLLTMVDCQLTTSDVDYQTANRMIPILLMDDADTLREIMVLASRRPTLAGRRQQQHIQETSARWRRHLRKLDHDLDVVIDFADQIQIDVGGSAGGRLTHGPRWLNAVHAVISAVAWLRQESKPRKKMEGSSSMILASRDDYRIARTVLREGHVLDERPLVPAPSFHVLKCWQAVAAADGNRPMSAPALYRRIAVAVDRGNMTRHLAPLILCELIRELPVRNCNRQKQYELTPIGLRTSTGSLLDSLPSPESILIDNEEVLNATF